MNGLLKFITCGSVDDGKSTLIGHILYDSKLLYADQEKALVLDSKVGSRGGEIDYSLLLDGLMAEREQGITIDVAYRYFTTERRSFIVADTPGHEEYTRNMAVGASFAQLAIILVDATQGVLVQTRRHCRICSLMGIRHFVFAVNKMDLVDYKEENFLIIKKEIIDLTKQLSLENVEVIPVSATKGDHVTKKSPNMPWYQGEPLLPYLEQVDVTEKEENLAFYMPIQRVCRPDHGFRGFQGQVESGEVWVGKKLMALPGKETARVKSLLIGNQSVDRARAGQPATITLDREVDVSRGCVLADKELPVSKEVKATLLWMDEEPLQCGNEYLLKLGTKMVPAVIKEVEYQIDVNTGSHMLAHTVMKNEIASCSLILSQSIVVDEFKKNKTLGELILIDRVSHMTSACGVIEKVEGTLEIPYFEKEGLKTGGSLFEELYFNLNQEYMFRKKTPKKTYRLGDLIPLKGDSFHYPDYFDVISPTDHAVVLIRNRTVYDIIPLNTYEFGGLPVLDKRGFSLNIHTREDLKAYLYDTLQEKEEKTLEVQNKWAKFEPYRKIVFG